MPAHRVGEDDGLRVLAAMLDLDDPDDVLDLVAGIVGGRRLDAAARLFVEAVLRPGG